MVRWCGLTLQRFLRRSLRCLRCGAANPLVIVRAMAYGGVVDLRDKTKLEGVEHVYLDRSRYSKAEVLLLDLSHRGEITGDLFAASQPVASEKLMGAEVL